MKEIRTLLIVEDSDVNRRILKRILLNKGYRVLEAADGQAALDILLEKRTGISLVLLDLTMPVMNGYELLQKMQEFNLLPSIPVIVVTGSGGGTAEVKSLELGASDFIIKPYNVEIVCHRIESILRLCDNTELISKLEKDSLTGLYTREAFYSYAKKMLDEHPDENFDIICSNVENFKMINTKYGSAAGDALLCYIGKQLMEFIGENGICGRTGVDNFVALRRSIGLCSQEEIGKMHENALLNSPVKNYIVQYGVYAKVDRSMSVVNMCDRAQFALSSIKHKYGMYHAVYNSSMGQKLLREHQLTDYMETALEQRQFVVYLQPKHSVETGGVAGAEALVRWVHPELGFISPGEFIPLFERNGFIIKLDRYVWETVCALLQKWMREGLELIPISVNASRIDFSLDNLPEAIMEMVDSYGIPHDMLHFEVTESAYTDNPQQIISTVAALRSMGFLIEMDDFGSGYSSLNMLSELPIDILKLDMKFMQKGGGLLPDSKRNILSFAVSLSKWLQLPTVAEGVETEDEVNLLKTMGCNYIQGYYYARPMPVADFEQYLVAHKKKNELVADSVTGNRGAALTGVLSGKKPHVLVVEDIESNREMLRGILEPNYTVETACNGAEAYEHIKHHCAEISCVLLDLLMPVMDGFQLIDTMHRDGYLDQLPVIITSEASSDSELRALHLGADSFVAKPYDPEILLHHVKKAVNEHEFRMICKTI